MFWHFVTAVCMATIVGICQCAPKEDLITSLPGLSKQPHFKQYSGYLQALGSRKLFYWFVESSSNPQTDPLVLWMNGGPGCSSLTGLLTENGPFRVNQDGHTLRYNPYSWTQAANIIFLEAPAGVGFSYSTDKNYTTNDDQTADNNMQALKEFFVKFPEYKNHDFYITGESYGGIYVPTLVSRVIDNGTMNLKGFAVGNGLLDSAMNDNSLVFFAYYHGLIGDSSWNKLLLACCPGGKSDNCNFTQGAKTSEQCGAHLVKVLSVVWSSGLDPYNLYDDCATDNSLHFDNSIGKFVSRNIMRPFAFLPTHMKEAEFLKSLPADQVFVSPPCTNDQSTITYLNLPQVREAIHVPSNVQKWQMCSAIDYHKQYMTVAPIFYKALNRKLRILVYNGDVDMACNFLGDEWFVDSLKPEDPQKRRPWYFKKSDGSKYIAGFVKVFDKITYVTVKGSGHMVPTDKPIPALEMFINFVQDRPF